MKEITIQEAALAWANGKRVQATARNGAGEFYDIGKPGSTSGMWNAAIFNGSENHKFRLAPEPPAKRYRPYNRAELCEHLGKVVEAEGGAFTALIIIVFHEAVHIGNSHYTFQSLLEDFTWKDGSPCGVEVEA
jgi:hypothetical protein